MTKAGPGAERGGGRRRRLAGLWVRGAILLAAVGLSGVFFLDYCALLFRCGCVALWAGGAAFCNIQQPGPPDCPFCAHPATAYWSLGGAVLAQGAALFWPDRGTGRPGLPARTLLAFLAFPVVVGAEGAVLALLVGYRP